MPSNTEVLCTVYNYANKKNHNLVSRVSPLPVGKRRGPGNEVEKIMGAFHSTKISGGPIEWNRIFSGKDFPKFRTTFSVFLKSGNFGIFENSRVPFKSFQSDCLNTYDKRRQEA